MAVRYSQTLCKNRLDKQGIKIVEATATANEDITLSDGGAGSDTIVGGSAIDFVTAGFKKGDKIYVLKATDVADNIEGVQCTAVTATTITLPTGTWTTGQSGSTAIIILATSGGAIKDILNNCNLTIFSGAQPDTPDEASTQKGAASALMTYYNLHFADATWDGTNLYAILALVEAASANADNTGTGAWFRVWIGESGDAATNRDAANTTSIRIDGSVGITTGDLRVVSTAFTVGQPQTLNSFNQFTKMVGSNV